MALPVSSQTVGVALLDIVLKWCVRLSVGASHPQCGKTCDFGSRTRVLQNNHHSNTLMSHRICWFL